MSETDIAAARAAMDGFMAAFNAEDAEAIRTPLVSTSRMCASTAAR